MSNSYPRRAFMVVGLIVIFVCTLVLSMVADLARPANAATIDRQLGQTATFTHVRVLVGNVIYSPAHGTLAYTSVCVRSLPTGSTGGRMRISWDPWTITTTSGTVRPSLYDASHPPESLFPRSSRVRVGDCVGGWLPYATARGPVTKINYASSLGDRAVWAAPPRTPDTALARTRTFRHFTVAVTRTTFDRYWAGAYVKTCVRSRPAGTTGKVRVSVEPWRITTNRGIFTTMIMQEGAPDFPGREYPWATSLNPGQCVQGWVAFALSGYGSGLRITSVDYRNALGNRATWSPR